MTDLSIGEAIRPCLQSVSTLSLATVGPEGRPHSVNLYFAPDDGLNLYFVSDPGSWHSRHLVHEPCVSGTVYPPVKMWQQIRGVQFHGECGPIDEGDWGRVWGVYLEKFPHIAEVEEMVRSQRFYVIRPSWFRWIDNAVKFGFKIESDWPAG